MIVRAYPFVARRRRPITHKHHFLLKLFSKNFVFLKQVGYATALSCYFGYKLCVIKLKEFTKAKLPLLPLFGGFSPVREWAISGFVSSFFRSVGWGLFMAQVFKKSWLLYLKLGWKFEPHWLAFSKRLSTVSWRLVVHRFWKKTSVGKWVLVPLPTSMKRQSKL